MLRSAVLRLTFRIFLCLAVVAYRHKDDEDDSDTADVVGESHRPRQPLMFVGHSVERRREVARCRTKKHRNRKDHYRQCSRTTERSFAQPTFHWTRQFSSPPCSLSSRSGGRTPGTRTTKRNRMR